MDETILEELGLTKGEVKIYLTVLELGQTKVGQIIEKSKMASSAVHNLVNTLIEKGLISYIKKGKIKYYQSIPPKQLIDLIEEKKSKILKILPELEQKQKKSTEKQEAEIFEGTKGIMSMLNILTGDSKKGDEYLFFAVNVKDQNKEIQKFFEMYDAKRQSKGLKSKGLAPKELKTLFKKRKILKIKYTSFPIPSNISLFKNKVAIFSWEEKPVGYFIKSKQIYEMYKNLFYSIWNKAN